MSTRYPYLTAYVGFIALGTVLNVILVFVSTLVVGPAYDQIVTWVVTILVSFFIFRYVIRRNVLPNVSQEAPEAN